MGAADEVNGDATLTAVVVPVPAADRVVGEHRARYDTAAGWGVPAHVTVLFPFVAPTDVDETVVAGLRAATALVPAFTAVLSTTGWFGDDVLYLHPVPAEPFRELTDAVARSFPDHPPYGGAHETVVPHLTVAEARHADVATLRDVEALVLPQLPVTLRVDHAVLLAGSTRPGSWRTVARLPLG